MFRKAFCSGLIVLLLGHAPLAADGGRQASSPTSSSSTKRVVWTLVGIGAGFGAGTLIGLHAFDDSINSDRKVWTSAVVGAAAGGFTAWLLTRHAGRVSPLDARGPGGTPVGVRFAPSISAGPTPSSDDDLLRRRVREISR